MPRKQGHHARSAKRRQPAQCEPETPVHWTDRAAKLAPFITALSPLLLAVMQWWWSRLGR